MFVKIWMNKSVISVHPKQSIGQARDLFKEHGIRRLPVVDEGLLVGILTPSDVERALPSIFDSEGAKDYDYLAANTEISTVMTSSPVTVSPDDTLVMAARKMRKNKVDGLSVVEEGRLVGIISITNVLDAFLEIMETNIEGTRFDLKIGLNRKAFYEMVAVFRRERKEIVAITQHYGFSPDSQLVTLQTADRDNDELVDQLWKEGIQVELITPVSKS